MHPASPSAESEPGYPVLAEPCQGEYQEKRSRFLALLHPVSQREQALQLIESLRRQHPGAAHYCWAYLLGSASQPLSQAFNDDGEPSGTAGKPILHVLTQRGAGDCLALVVRHFGGIKLGAGGLVRAYGAAVSEALNQAQWRQVTPKVQRRVEVDFALEERVRHCLAQHQTNLDSVDYAQGVALTLTLPQNEEASLRASLQEATNGQLTWRKL